MIVFKYLNSDNPVVSYYATDVNFVSLDSYDMDSWGCFSSISTIDISLITGGAYPSHCRQEEYV